MAVDTVLYPFYIGGLFILISEIVNGEETPKFLPILYKAAMIWWPFTLVTILAVLIVTVGLILFIFPGIYLGLRLFFVQFNVVFKGLSPFEAISVTYKSTKSCYWILFKIMLPVILFVIALSYIASFLEADVSGKIIYVSDMLFGIIFMYISVLQFRLYRLFGNEES